MLVLAFDTSSPAVTVAVVSVDVTADPPGVAPGRRLESGSVPVPVSVSLAHRTEIAVNRHGELLAPLISEALHTADATPRDLDAIAVGRGPGPFTGLRVGIVTAKAMADALGIPVYSAASLDLIGRDLLDGRRDGAARERGVVAMSDARRKQVYWARFDAAGVRLGGPEISHPADLAAMLDPDAEHLGGAGARLYREAFSAFVVMEHAAYPSASTLARSVSGRLLADAPSDDLTPLYLRRPDAQPPGRLKQVTPA